MCGALDRGGYKPMADQQEPTRPDDARDIARDLRTLAASALPHTAGLLREAPEIAQREAGRHPELSVLGAVVEHERVEQVRAHRGLAAQQAVARKHGGQRHTQADPGGCAQHGPCHGVGAGFTLEDRQEADRFKPVVSRGAQLTFADDAISSNFDLFHPASGVLVTLPSRCGPSL